VKIWRKKSAPVFLKIIQSDFRIAGQKPLISLQNPWALSVKKAEFISMSDFYEKVRTFFLDGNS